MEKLLRRTLLNRNQLVKKDRRKLGKEVRKTWREYNRIKNAQALEVQNLIKQEQKARREDWILGPLAPKRDAGARTQTYGAVTNMLLQGAKLPKGDQRWPRGNGFDAEGSEDKRIPGFENGEWRGEGLIGNLVVGDRVVVVNGRLGVKGRIGEVSRIDTDSNSVFVRDVNKVDMAIPAQAIPTSNNKLTFEQEVPINITDLRLIVTTTNPTTGQLEDMIVRHVYGGLPWVQRNRGSNLPRHTRYIKNVHIPSSPDNPTPTTKDEELPWPKEDVDRFLSQPADTTRIEVEKVTYTPHLIDELPMPEGVIDELRNKHARTRRDWDDPEWMQRKMLEDARRDWFQERSKVLSQPFWSREYLRKEKRDLEARRLAAEPEEL